MIDNEIKKIKSEFGDHTKMLKFMNDDLNSRILKEVHNATIELKQSNFEFEARIGPSDNFSTPKGLLENFVTNKELKRMLQDKTNI